MAAEVLGGASALEAAPNGEARPQVAQPPLDLKFVTAAVSDPAWRAWGEPFENLDDLLARIESHLQPDRRVGRLRLAAYSAEHTSGFMAFDAGFTSRERIDGLNQTPIKPDVAAKLERLRALLDPEGIVELQVAGIGKGEHGLKALRALAAVVGVAVRGPVAKAAEVLPSLGLITEWLTVRPDGRELRSQWIEVAGELRRSIELTYVPVPDEEPPAALSADAIELVFATENARRWVPHAEPISGVADFVDKAIQRAGARSIGRLALISMGSPLYDGFVAFDAAGGESIDGSIREQPEFPHLSVMYGQVRSELERLRPHLAATAEVELRVARLGSGDAGRRALEKLHEVLGVAVRAPSASIGELRAAGGLATRWLTVGPRGVLESRWLDEPAFGPALEPATFVPLKGVTPPLGRRVSTPASAAAPAAALSLPPLPASLPEGATVVVRCGGCHRALDEPPATPTRARMPCPKCGSLARTREIVPAKRERRGRLRRFFPS